MAKKLPRKPARKSTRKPAAAPKSRRVARVATRTLKKRVPATVAAAEKPRPGRIVAAAESNLTRKDLEQFRELLMTKRSQLRGDVTNMQNEALGKNRRDAAGDLSNMPLHMADLGTDNYEQEFTLGLIEGEQTLLREIDEALQRIATGKYGICLATGRPIGKARLRAKPWAKFCYEYTLQQEQGRQRRL
ncbi:MAG: TraR/DksA C4-type zinc finger protein [Phycisphaerae bacterium]